MVQPLKFGSEEVISFFHTSLGERLFIHVGIKVNPCQQNSLIRDPLQILVSKVEWSNKINLAWNIAPSKFKTVWYALPWNNTDLGFVYHWNFKREEQMKIKPSTKIQQNKTKMLETPLIQAIAWHQAPSHCLYQCCRRYPMDYYVTLVLTGNVFGILFWAPSQYKDRLIYVWRFPC